MAIYQYPGDFAETQWLVYDANIYVCSSIVSDTPDGSPVNPYTTVQQAIDNSSNGDKIAVFLQNFNEGCKFEGLQIKNYAHVIGYNPSIQEYYFENLKIRDCGMFNARHQVKNSLILNTVVVADNEVSFEHCTFMIAEFGIALQNKFKTINDCIFGSTCTLKINSATTLSFDYCNFEPGSTIKIDLASFPSLATAFYYFPQYFEHCLNVVSGFNNVGMNDFSLSSQSQLINLGSSETHIGAVTVGQSFHNSIEMHSSSMLDYAILINVSVTDEGNYVITPPHNTGIIQTVEIDLGLITTPGRISIFADQNFENPPNNSVADVHNDFVHPNLLTYEMRYSSVAGELATLAYKEFAWNKQPMVDINGNGNGSSNFDLLSAMPITARYVQLQITLKDDSFFLLNEDGTYILQEIQFKLIIEF